MSAIATQPTPRVLSRAAVPTVRATIVLPAFNEQAGIAVALRELMPLVDETIEVLVINDGSTDGTGAVARALGARVIDHDRNLGKAAAVRTAVRSARGERLVLMDADGTYPAGAALQIVRLLDRFDMVVGARQRGRTNIPLLNRLGNGFFRLALRRISGLRLADPLTGLYGLHRRHLAAMGLDAEGFAVEAEIVMRAGHMGLHTANLPIAYRSRAGRSKLNPLRDGLAIAGTILRVAMNRRSPRRALRRPRRRDVMAEGGADLPDIPHVRSPRRGPETAAVGLVCLLGAATVGRIIAMGSYFTWDEAVYALTARSWLDGTPSTGWATHRPPGVSLLGVITLLVSHADAAFRLWGLAFGVLAIVGAWWLARGITGPIAGVLAAGVVAGIEPLLFNAGLYLTDVPATAMMLVLMGFLWRQFESEGPLSRTFLLAAPIAATAFYLRYGASLPIVWIGLTCAILWPRRLLAGWPTVLGAVGLLLVLLVPHFVLATAWTGVPWGIALGAQDLAAPAHPGDALGEYLADFPFRLAGGLAGVSMLVGLAGWAWFVADALIGRRHPGDARAMTFLALPALVTAGVLGFVALAQVRYILLPIALLTAMGPVALVLSVRHVPLAWHSAAGRGLVAAVAALLVLAAIANPWADVLATGARDARRQAEMPEVARQIVTMTDGQTCSVLTALVPNITWTTGCAAYGFGNPPQAGREAQLTGARRYLVLLAAADPRQPAGDLRADYLRLTDGPPVEVRNPRTGDVAVSIYRLR